MNRRSAGLSVGVLVSQVVRNRTQWNPCQTHPHRTAEGIRAGQVAIAVVIETGHID